MNILHVIHRYYPAIGGAERYVQEISERLARDGHRVSVYTTNARDIEYLFSSSLGTPVVAPEEEVINGVAIRRFQVAHLPFQKQILTILSLCPSWRVRALLYPYQTIVPGLFRAAHDTEKFDIVAAASSPFTSLLFMGYRIARHINAPFVITPFLHLGEEGDDRVRREHTRAHQIHLLRRADALLPSTESERRFLVGAGVHPDRLTIVGPGVDPSLASGGVGERFRRLYNLPSSTHIVVHIARWSAEKGTLQLLQALHILLRNGRNVKLVLIGGPTQSFRSFWSSAPEEIRDNCLMLEFPDEHVKHDALAAADLFAMPSHVESFGIVYLEAWLHHKPVIGADTPALRDLITHEKDGLLVRFGDPEELARSIGQLLDNPEAARHMGDTGYRKVLSQHTWDIKYSRILGVYQRLAAGGHH